MQKQNSLLFNVTFFTATGTIRVQGSDYTPFHELHFVQLIELVDLIASDLSEITTSILQPTGNRWQNDEHEPYRRPGDEHETVAKPDNGLCDETVAKHYDSIKTPEPAPCTEMPHAYDNPPNCKMTQVLSHIKQLQDSITSVLDKMSISQTNMAKDIMQQLQQISSQQNVKNSKSDGVLEGRVKSFENELQFSKFNATLSKEESEYYIRHPVRPNTERIRSKYILPWEGNRISHELNHYNKRPKGPHIVHLSTMCHLFDGSVIFVYSLARKTQTW